MLLIFRRISYLILISIIIFGTSCNKNQNTDKSLPAGIALTFDDYSVDNWYAYADLLDSLNVKATFYISNFNKLNASQIHKLHNLQLRGHEIAFHSTNHVNFVKYLEKNKCDKLIEEEIVNGLQLMNREGFYPQTFAYPFGAHTDALDKILLKYFKSVRVLNGTKDLTTSLSPLSNNTMLHGLGIDEQSKRSLGQIEGLLNQASQKRSCAVLLVHNIERRDTQLELPLWKLRRILLKAISLNLKFYTITELSK